MKLLIELWSVYSAARVTDLMSYDLTGPIVQQSRMVLIL